MFVFFLCQNCIYSVVWLGFVFCCGFLLLFFLFCLFAGGVDWFVCFVGYGFGVFCCFLSGGMFVCFFFHWLLLSV